MNQPLLDNKRIINAWCMYDWANSVYSLVITTAIFPVFYQTFTEESFGSDRVVFFGFEMINTVLYSYALSFSFLVVSILLPFLSGIADYTGNKKFFMRIFVYLGSTACIALYFFDGSNVEFGIICSMLASIGFSGSLVFYDAFLPEIASSSQYDMVSAKGYSLGYLGSVLLLVVILIMVTLYDQIGFESVKEAMQISFLMVGLWWAGFSQISFARLPTYTHEKPKDRNYLVRGYAELRKVWSSLKKLTGIRIFLSSFFFYNMGVQTVILLAATFASKVLGMGGNSLILTILIIQLVAILGAYFFAAVSRSKGNKAALLIMIAIWFGICIAAYLVRTEYQFYGVAAIVGLVLGGIQSLSRSTYSKLLPEDSLDHASFFSFYDVTYYLSGVVGTFLYGLIEQLTNDMRQNTLVLASYFVIGFIILTRIKLNLEVHKA